MMALWRSAAKREAERMAGLAVVTRAAVATAITNTIAGKDVPEFDEMVERLAGSEGPPVDVIARDEALLSMGLSKKTDGASLEQMEEF